MEIIIKILDWNVGGAKYLQEKEERREEIRDNINDGLKKLHA